MEDSRIIDLFNERSEMAIVELSKKYGDSLKSVAYNIIKNEHDAEECINDAYLKLWNLIPPNYPRQLFVYALKIVRTTTIDAWRIKKAAKRKSEEAVDFDTLENYMGEYSIEQTLSEKELSKSISDFLHSLETADRVMFVKRYFYCQSVNEIAFSMSKTPHSVTVRLSRIKDRLKDHLMKEGIIV